MSTTPASNEVTKIETEYDLLSGEVKRAIADAVKVGGSTVAVLGVISTALPHIGLPAADLAEITGIVTAASGLISLLARKLLLLKA
jgi:hypothetical protein